MKKFIFGLIAFLAIFIVGGIVISFVGVDVKQTEVTTTLSPNDIQPASPAQ